MAEIVARVVAARVEVIQPGIISVSNAAPAALSKINGGMFAL
jgi:hypothetical protein